MSVKIETFGIQNLSIPDRLELIEQIWNSLPTEVSPQDVPEWHLAELASRRATAKAQPGSGKPWSAALDAIEDKS